eukprot:6743755-Prymnesium_polylepis.1
MLCEARLKLRQEFERLFDAALLCRVEHEARLLRFEPPLSTDARARSRLLKGEEVARQQAPTLLTRDRHRA